MGRCGGDGDATWHTAAAECGPHALSAATGAHLRDDVLYRTEPGCISCRTCSWCHGVRGWHHGVTESSLGVSKAVCLPRESSEKCHNFDVHGSSQAIC